MAETKNDVTDVFERLFLLGVGAFSLTKEKVESVVNELVERGKLSQEEGRSLVTEIGERGMKEKDAITTYVSEAIRRVIDRSDLATKRDLAKLEAEVADLKKQLADAERPARTPAPKK
jgi:polyhydroxyalkanoate synthesis regulator phasin